jgi:hypothetical protein
MAQTGQKPATGQNLAIPSLLQPIPSAVKTYVRLEAEQYGVDPSVAEFIVSHESQDGQNMRGDDGHSRGYWMIDADYHPEVTDQCADDLHCSTAWSLTQIKAGYVNWWSTWKYRCKWYGVCN